LNHAAIDSGIPRESATQRLGITWSFLIPLWVITGLFLNVMFPGIGIIPTLAIIWISHWLVSVGFRVAEIRRENRELGI
jgi:hypothetical protein